MRRDVLSLSTVHEVAIVRDPGSPVIGLFNPFADAVVLCTGSPETQAISTIQADATPLQRDGGRGASVSGIQFDWAGFCSCWISFGAVDNSASQLAFIVRHWMAIVKAPFDVLQYETDGTVVPKWNAVPNIIVSPRDVARAQISDLMFDPPVEIFWRGYEEAISHNCITCRPCGKETSCNGNDGEDCNEGMVGPQWVTGTVNMQNGAYADQSLARNYNMRHVKLRTRRFLKEDECLVLVHNWVVNLPANSEVVWDTTIYGTAAIKLAR